MEPTASKEVQGQTVLKKNRSVRKGKLTIALKELHAEIRQEEVVADQIRLLLDRTKTRFDAVEEARDALVDIIMEEDQIVKEQEWFGVVVNDYNKVTRVARKILGGVGKTPINEIINQVSKSSPVQAADKDVNTVNVNTSDSVTEGSSNESINDVETQGGNDDIVNVSNPIKSNVSGSGSVIANPLNENSILSMVQAMALPKTHVKKFDGDPLFYYTFMASFNNSVSCISDDSIKLNVLRSLCCGRALDATEFCILKPPTEGLKAALTTLKKRFGNSAVIVQAWIQKIISRPKVDASKLEGFADDLTNCYQALDALGYLQELSNQGSLKSIIDKLPKFLQQRWTREVFKLRERDQVPSLQNVVKFVKSSACEINDPVFGTAVDSHKPKPGERTNGRVFQTDTRVLNTELKTFSRWKKCWGCETDDHWPDQCPSLLELSADERMKQAKDNHVCFACFKRASKQHSMRNCQRRKKCTQCKKFHHPLLHLTTRSTTQLMTHDLASHDDVDVVMPMVSAKVMGKKRNILFDTCATLTLIRDNLAKQCKFTHKPVTVEITTLGSETTLLHTKAYNVPVMSEDGTSYTLTAIGVPSIAEIPMISTELRSKVERHLGEPIHRGSGSADILIGINYAKMHAGSCIDMGDYVVRKSPLGWVLFGTNAKDATKQHRNPVLLVKMAEPVDISKFWSTEEMGVKCDCDCKGSEPVLSPDGKRKFNEMWNSCVKDEDGHWVVSYPWVKPPDNLSDNERQCYAKLCSLEKRLKKSPVSANQYSKAINDLVEKGFAKKLTDNEKKDYSGPIHYIPHHAVERPESSSTPIRIVFNSSSVCDGLSLNDHWGKGPDLLKNLMGVILRFREYKIGIAGDISKMFYQVRIPTTDKHVHRFLWRNFEDRSPDTYILNIVTPGDKPAPSMAITALLKTAKENKNDHPHAAQVLKQDTYMDDICTSVKSDQDAVRLTKDIDCVLATAGFKVKKWVSNIQQHADQGCAEQLVASEDSEQKVLGVVWDPKTDELKYKVQQESLQEKLTKRIVLSEISKLFDPIGFAGAFLIRAKIMMQRLWAAGVGWDDELTVEETSSWLKFFAEMKNLHGISFQRCLFPQPDADTIQLIVFCDASEAAFGAVCYVRWMVSDDVFDVRFLTAKSRVAPLKALSIPRLELQAALLATRLYASVTKEITVKVQRPIFLSDSIIALSWIRGQSRLYKSFVANRVAEIQTHTDPADWKHVPGELNVADKISRGVCVQDLQGEWKEGPVFLRSPEHQWPSSIPKANEEVVDSEKRKLRTVLLIKKPEVAINITKYSSWRKLLRITAFVFRFLTNTKAKCCVDDGPLSVHEIMVAERFWVIEAQKSLKELREYKTLSPFMKNGVVYVGGRTSCEKLSYDQAYPILLPRNHRVSYLITRQIHETGHYGVATTAAKVRQRFWIVKATTLAKTVKFRCIKCRLFEHKSESQLMADLPVERVTPYSPPFHYTAIDYFGPYHVKISRNKTTKHYGVIFTCMTTRAVHLELAVDCSTQEFIQVLRRFYAMRGRPKVIQSDNGTQFIGAERELRKMIIGWSKDELKEFCANKQVTWRFTTPLAPHHNGCAESLVKSCKRALKKSIGNQMLTPFELYTYLQEVANLINERPIGRKVNDPDDGAYICPNDILLGRSTSHVPQGPFCETKNPQRRVEYVQKLVDAFWKAWIRDVFPSLVPRKKWSVERRDVRVGDVVTLADPNSTRGKWTIARVTAVYPGKDNHVRNVTVKTQSGNYVRPITKLAVICPVEGFD